MEKQPKTESRAKGDKSGAGLQRWQERLERARVAYELELARMDRRERLYLGDKSIAPLASPGGEHWGETKQGSYVRNVVAELIESQVNSNIPQPKVTAHRPEDEEKARLIEDMLRNEIDRLPFEMMNDQQERTCPIQGGSLFMVEWDAASRGFGTLGEVTVQDLHPKKVIPQDGVTSGIEDMDYIFILLPQTKAYIKRRYGAQVDDEEESDPEVRALDSRSDQSDLVTQVIAYYRNDEGGIGLYTWVNDIELEHMEDYQARRLEVCQKCGMPGDGKVCSFCGSKAFSVEHQQDELVVEDIIRSDGSVIPAFSEARDDSGFPLFDMEVGADGIPVQVTRLEPTRLPYYKPDIYPVVLRKNVSVFGRFLGDSDVDKVEDQQNSLKKLGTKIHSKLLGGGSILSLPQDLKIEVTDGEMQVVRLSNPVQRDQIQVYTLQPNIQLDLLMYNQAYEEARQIIGITDSFQGRRDATATSGVAKEFAAAQAAGRLESKRVQKEAAYAALFEAMFKFKLAYADEPRPVVSTDNQGNKKYTTFNRYDFLDQDMTGAWRWNDDFMFSCDAAATLANNREAMWQETRMNFQQGAYGNPQEVQTLILFWTRMEQLHYPGAADTRTYFEEQLQQQQMQQQAMQAAMGGGVPGGIDPAAQMPIGTPMDIGVPMPGSMMRGGGGGVMPGV